MTQVSLGRGCRTTVHGWEHRHAAFPGIAEQIRFAQDSEGRFQLMFRGDRNPPPREQDLFLIGQKARPAYYEGDPNRLEFNFRALGDDQVLFREVAEAFVGSPMHKKSPTADELLTRYWASSPQERMRLGRLLLYGLHYQNLRPTVRRWRDYAFAMSCTTDERIALRYALKELPPNAAYILEYAPPGRGDWFCRVSDVIEEYNELELGHIFPDKDSEIFVNYGMFPHYLLGYSVLNRIGSGAPVYEAVYVPNPWYAKRGATLVEPPNLNREQAEIIQATGGEIAWITHNGTDWRVVSLPDRRINISQPEEDVTEGQEHD